MTWTWVLLIASATGFTAFGFILCALLTWPERGVPEHPQPRHLRVLTFSWSDPPEPPPTFYNWQQDAQALGWLEGA